MGDGRVFIPLKMRQAVTENDAVYGYVDMAYMGEPEARAGKECPQRARDGRSMIAPTTSIIATNLSLRKLLNTSLC
jgi:hypothetical protein